MRLAVVGLGFMGSAHLQALRSVPEAELVAVFDRSEKKLQGDFSDVQGNFGGLGANIDFGGVKRYRDLQALLENTGIEAVDICLPTHLHEPVVIEALRQRKHVLVEKPMAIDSSEAARMAAVAKTSGRVLMVAHVLRFMAGYEALRDILRGGQLGEARFIEFRRACAWPAWSEWLSDPLRSGGAALDLLVHDIDIAVQLFGKPVSVSASGAFRPEQGIDVISAALHYGNGLDAVINGGWFHRGEYPLSMGYTLVADQGTLEFQSDSPALRLYRDQGGKELIPLPEKDGYAAEIAYFVECCRDGAGYPERCPPEDSATAVALSELLREARKRSGEKVICRI